MRVQSNQQDVEDELYCLLADHLGSTAITLDESGGRVAELRYSAWVETRTTSDMTEPDCKYTKLREEERD